MRKHVAPVEPAASIPDPERGGFLPSEGRTVSWTPHWAGMAMREEIRVSEPSEDAGAATPGPEASAAAEAAEIPHEGAEAHSGA